MVILAANQVWWTWEVEDVFRRVRRGDKMALKNYAKKLHLQIDALVVQVGGWVLCTPTHEVGHMQTFSASGACVSYIVLRM